MPEKINWTLSAQVIGGPKISVAKTMDVDAYDKIHVSIDAKATDAEVEIQPGGSGQVQFLLISADQYNDKVSYKVNDEASTTIILLDGPHLLIGSGAVGLLDEAPTSLFFSNDLDSNVSIDILVGRDATP